MLKFTNSEIRDLIIAFIVLSFCFAISTVGFKVYEIISLLPIVMVGVALGILLHEIGHKFAAMRHGYQAVFKLWPLGLLIGILSSFIGFVFAVPGSVETFEELDDEMNGKIKIAGPMANILLALISIIIAALIYPLSIHSKIFHLIYLISTIGFSVNSFLATFNLLPIYTFDGTKVMKWSLKVWIVTFAIAAIMMLSTISIGAENLVQMFIII